MAADRGRSSANRVRHGWPGRDLVEAPDCGGSPRSSARHNRRAEMSSRARDRRRPLRLWRARKSTRVCTHMRTAPWRSHLELIAVAQDELRLSRAAWRTAEISSRGARDPARQTRHCGRRWSRCGTPRFRGRWGARAAWLRAGVRTCADRSPVAEHGLAEAAHGHHRALRSLTKAPCSSCRFGRAWSTSPIRGTALASHCVCARVRPRWMSASESSSLTATIDIPT